MTNGLQVDQEFGRQAVHAFASGTINSLIILLKKWNSLLTISYQLEIYYIFERILDRIDAYHYSFSFFFENRLDG